MHTHCGQDGDVGRCLRTPFVLAPLRDRLRTLGVPCELSTDPGRYICNFTYYNSRRLADELRRTLGVRVHVLFVHVPSFQCIAQEQQVDHLATLLREVLDASAGLP